MAHPDLSAALANAQPEKQFARVTGFKSLEIGAGGAVTLTCESLEVTAPVHAATSTTAPAPPACGRIVAEVLSDGTYRLHSFIGDRPDASYGTLTESQFVRELLRVVHELREAVSRGPSQ